MSLVAAVTAGAVVQTHLANRLSCSVTARAEMGLTLDRLKPLPVFLLLNQVRQFSAVPFHTPHAISGDLP